MNKTLHASSLERYFNCPGALLAEQNLPECPPDPAAESGTRIHQALRMFFSEISQNFSDIGIVYNLNEREKIIATWFSNHTFDEIEKHEGTIAKYPELKCENEYGDGIVGTADLVVHCADNSWHVFEFKTGYGQQIEARKNLQLRTYIVKVADMFKMFYLKTVTGHLYSAADVGDAQFTSVTFDEHDIIAARREIYEIRDRCYDPDARRYTGEWCAYCRANGNVQGRCPESMLIPQVPAIKIVPMPPELAAKCAGIWQQIQVFEKSAKAFKQYIRQQLLIAAPDSIPGLCLKPGKSWREVKDAEGFFSAGIKAGLFSQADFVREAIKVSLPQVEKLVKQSAGVSGKIAAQIVKDQLSEFIETGVNEPSVESLPYLPYKGEDEE